MANGAPNGAPNGRAWYLEAFKLVGFPVAIVVFWLAQDANYLPSNSRENLAINRVILADVKDALETQRQWHEDVVARHARLLEELRALRRRQAALCFMMLTTLTNAGKDKDVITIREACVAEAMQGTP